LDPEEIAVIMPALDEEAAIPRVLTDLADLGLLRNTIVVDNGSRDGTARIATSMGAMVVREEQRGYGAACLRGLEALDRCLPSPSIVVFIDADRSDDPHQIPDLVRPISEAGRDLVIGSRNRGRAEPGALFWHQRLGSQIFCLAIHALYGHRYSDLGPFRAIRREALQRLEMRDPTFGWTVEMQVKAILARLRVAEIPVTYRRRVGRSKISGTLAGSVKAAFKIGWTIAALRIRGA
jgi:glycosyltransferase involved in cell wall biosynthesis